MKTALPDQYHKKDHLYNMQFKLNELKQGSLLEEYISDLDKLVCHLQLSKQQKILYFVFALKTKLKQTFFVRQPQTYDDAVTFANWKHHFTYSKSETNLIEFLQDIRNEVSLKHTGIKKEPNLASIQDTHNAPL